MTNKQGAERPERRSIRLKGHDYSQPGAYFVTICTQNRECVFGEIQDGVMVSNDAGRMVHTVWDEIPGRYIGVAVDVFVVMPNHIHGIIILSDVGATLRGCPVPPVRKPGQAQGPAPTLSLPDVVGRLKSLTTNQYRQAVVGSGWPAFDKRLWQRNYYEHVVRDDQELDRIREYIVDNPAMWAEDENNPGIS